MPAGTEPGRSLYGAYRPLMYPTSFRSFGRGPVSRWEKLPLEAAAVLMMSTKSGNYPIPSSRSSAAFRSVPPA